MFNCAVMTRSDLRVLASTASVFIRAAAHGRVLKRACVRMHACLPLSRRLESGMYTQSAIARLICQNEGCSRRRFRDA